MDGRKIYIDSSVVLRRILEQPGAIENWSTWELAVSSELMSVEVLRALDRMRVTGRLSAVQMAEYAEELRMWTAAFDEVPLDRSILRRTAASFPTPLGTLDAIHLATALIWSEANKEDLVFLTHDRQLALAARACGLDVKTAP